VAEALPDDSREREALNPAALRAAASQQAILLPMLVELLGGLLAVLLAYRRLAQESSLGQ